MRGLAKESQELIRYARAVLAEDHPMTLRQLHYAIFSRAEIAYRNDTAHYKKLSRATTTARRAARDAALAGLPEPELSIPAEWMVDETREGETVNVWRDAASYIEAVKRSYRRDNWQDQPSHVEVWSEKATILAAVRPVANEWGFTLRVCHGFGSTGMEQQVGQYFSQIDREITVLYLGDHDPSGHVIEADIHQRVQRAAGREFRMERLAIHPADIRQFNLPPQAIKVSDSRAAGFQQKYGLTAATVELDALPAAELRRRIEVAIKRQINLELWNRQIAIQELEFECIASVASTFKSLPRPDGQVQP